MKYDGRLLIPVVCSKVIDSYSRVKVISLWLLLLSNQRMSLLLMSICAAQNVGPHWAEEDQVQLRHRSSDDGLSSSELGLA